MKEQRRDQSDLGSVVQKHRLWVNKSQRQVARDTGLHHGFIARLERGERGISVDTLARLGKSLGIGFLFEYISAIINEQVEADYQHRRANRPQTSASQSTDQGRTLDQTRDTDGHGETTEYYIWTNGVRTKIEVPVRLLGNIHLPYQE